MISKAIGWWACACAVVLRAGAFVSGALADAAPSLRVSGAWVLVSPVAGRPAAAYATIDGGAQPDRLIAVTSSAAARATLHDNTMAHGMMHMADMASVAIPARGHVELAPGGMHVMLYTVHATGRTVPLTLRFASGATVAVDAEVRTAGK